jgi:hypothetical protein
VVLVPLQPGMQAELTAAMRGSAGAFLVTPPIIKVPPADHEFTLGQELANAAVAAGVEHVVFSGLENVEARTGGTKWAPHFTDKARVEAYIRSLRRLVALLSGLWRQRALRARVGGHGGIRRRIWLLRPRARLDVESGNRSACVPKWGQPQCSHQNSAQ